MSTRYIPMVNAAKDRLALLAPTRVVTRNWEDFAARPQTDLEQGIYTVLWGGVLAYPYEASDNQDPSSSLRATEHGRVPIQIIGQLLLPETATGEDVDLAEAEMLDELEQLADEAMEIDGLQMLLLKSARTSKQIERPYAWVTTYWEAFPVE